MRTLFYAVILLITSISISKAQELETILEDHYKAASQVRMQKVETIVTTGKNMYSMAGVESGFTMYQSRPNKLRIEAEVQGTQLIQTYNGATGWIYAPAMGISQPKELTEQELKNILNHAEFENPLWNYREKGSTLELIGTSEDGSSDHLKLTTSNKDVLNFFINKESHLITAIKTSQLMGGSEQEIEINMKDYKNVKGIPVAHYIATKIGGETVYTVSIEKIEYDQELDATLFEKPEVK